MHDVWKRCIFDSVAWHSGYFTPHVMLPGAKGELWTNGEMIKKKGGNTSSSKALSTRNWGPHGQEELAGLQLVLVVEHHRVHPGDGTILQGKRAHLYRQSANSKIMQVQVWLNEKSFLHCGESEKCSDIILHNVTAVYKTRPPHFNVTFIDS